MPDSAWLERLFKAVRRSLDFYSDVVGPVITFGSIPVGVLMIAVGRPGGEFFLVVGWACIGGLLISKFQKSPDKEKISDDGIFEKYVATPFWWVIFFLLFPVFGATAVYMGVNGVLEGAVFMGVFLVIFGLGFVLFGTYAVLNLVLRRRADECSGSGIDETPST